MRILKKGLGQCAVIFALMQATTRTEAAPSNFPRPDFPVPDGTVFSLLVTNSVLYLSGDFQIVANQSRPYLAALDVQNGRVLNWEPDVRGPVSAMAVSSNTLYVGMQIEIWPTNAIDAFDIPTGQRPPAWTGYVSVISIPGITTRINALALGPGRLYVGDKWHGRVIHALEPTSGAVLPWNPNPSYDNPSYQSGVEAIQVVGNIVYAGGYFALSGGSPPLTNLVALDRDTAAALPGFPVANGRVRSLVVAGNFLYVGGEFTALGGQPRHGLAAIELSTGNVTPWNPSGTNLNTIRALGVSGNTVYAAGTFQNIGGQARTNLAALDATMGQATAWQPSVTNQINALVVASDTVYVGGGQAYPVNSYLGVFPPQGWSVLSQARLTNGNFSFRLLGEEGSNYVIQASATLTNWSSVHTNTVTSGGFDFTEPATNLAPRFYRARPGP